MSMMKRLVKTSQPVCFSLRLCVFARETHQSLSAAAPSWKLGLQFAASVADKKHTTSCIGKCRYANLYLKEYLAFLVFPFNCISFAATVEPIHPIHLVYPVKKRFSTEWTGSTGNHSFSEHSAPWREDKNSRRLNEPYAISASACCRSSIKSSACSNPTEMRMSSADRPVSANRSGGNSFK